jgi:hypothetical protein
MIGALERCCSGSLYDPLETFPVGLKAVDTHTGFYHVVVGQEPGDPRFDATPVDR